MGKNLALQKLYVELGTLQNQKNAVADMAFAAAVNVGDVDSGIGPAGDDAESTGISTFRRISIALRDQVCGNSELQHAAQGAGLTEDKVKEVVAGIAASVPGLGGAWPAIVAGIVVTLFFDTAAPLICQKWAAWNSNPSSDAYQPNPALSTNGG
ncbi:hypothetical protein [Ralstonia pseudosolanacearum]|uniref:hypothetical protein n=1 Tax=Ralstonia pseudosolanacearum TaxID=1310165 RepID=UPI0026756854|nr:hypothetical protein [Ralstonia pseudosolanacearum]MDO3524736.1 hypothetical protein [Ralstonia pseudosolanacearum]MDO3549794.1 hypothetical protein [Ralstonia pseudosolanacearum]MDO3554431.1 hypothetical protein [Ralstonia pseudosolanacearum]MDO3569151.1 hypothetical protein [Ralstonia pseudosolanacearum]MDO3584411.1 hypothetical protein [Ralstonia pseudosolanacearum]